MIVPVTLNYLKAEEYGVWLTLSSLLGWIAFFDIGLGNGLRNKLTEAIVEGNLEKGRKYISTTFALLLIITIIIFITFNAISPFLNWSRIFNTSTLQNSELEKVVFITFVFICLQFIFKTIGIIYMAHQRSAISDLLNVISSAISLIIIYTLTITTSGSLLFVAITFSAAPIVVFTIMYFVAFNSTYKELKPSIKSINFTYTKDLLGLGVQFFIIQISSVIVFLTSNIIITQFCGPDQVSVYNIAYKYFNVVVMLFSIFLSPLWNAYNEAYNKGEMLWIKNTLRRIFQIWTLFVLLTLIMLIISPLVYQLWIGNVIQIPFRLSLACFLYVSLYNWNQITSYFLYGVGKIRIQLYISIVSSLLFLPVAIFLVKKFGIEGMLYAMTITLVFGAVIQPIQTFKIIKNRTLETNN
jgi:O-antigen/teichoic acid export membrane protein